MKNFTGRPKMLPDKWDRRLLYFLLVCGTLGTIFDIILREWDHIGYKATLAMLAWRTLDWINEYEGEIEVYRKAYNSERALNKVLNKLLLKK